MLSTIGSYKIGDDWFRHCKRCPLILLIIQVCVVLQIALLRQKKSEENQQEESEEIKSIKKVKMLLKACLVSCKHTLIIVHKSVRVILLTVISLD